VCDSNDARCATLARWLEVHNNQRRHSAVGGQPRSADAHQRDSRVPLAVGRTPRWQRCQRRAGSQSWNDRGTCEASQPTPFSE
jgi:hypothetical protein